MSPLIILSLALVVVALGMVVVAVVVLLRAVGGLKEAGRLAGERVGPLIEELQAEQAVTALELEALQRNAAARREVRSGGRRGKVGS